MSSFLQYARLVRLPNVFTAMADICLAGLAVGAIPDKLTPFVLLLLASAALYASGMVWNDYFDVEQDKRERPFRPIPSGKVSPRSAMLLALILMAGGLVLAFLADQLQGNKGGWSLPLAIGLATAIFLYDGWLKRTWAGPIGMGLCRFLNILLGLSAAGEWTGWWGVALALAVGVYISGVTWFARTEAKVSNQNTLAGAAAIMALGLVIGLTVPILAEEGNAQPRTAFGFPYLLAIFGIYLAVPLVRAMRRPFPDRVQAAVKRAVLGLIVFDAVLATGLAGIIGLLILILLPPALLLGRWVYST